MTVGSIITGDLISIVASAGGEVRELGDGTAVVATMADLVQVYARIYNEMQATGEATITQLNSVYAQMLTARDQGNIDAISALDNAMGMTYEELGNLLAQYGRGAMNSLEFAMNHMAGIGLEMLGNGQVRIANFH